MGQVLFVDSNPVFRLGLRALVAECEPALVIVEAASFADARSILRIDATTSLILLDINTSDCGGFVGLLQLRKEFPHVPVIVVSQIADSETVSRAVAFGAVGFISKSASCKTITETLKAVLSNSPWNAVPMIADDRQVNPIAALSPAQLRVLKGLKKGLRNKEIAFELGLTEKTVKAYMSTLYRKLGVTSRTQALILVQDVALEVQ